jgi:hypothetical protein
MTDLDVEDAWRTAETTRLQNLGRLGIATPGDVFELLLHLRWFEDQARAVPLETS